MTNRQLKVVQVSGELLQQLFTQGTRGEIECIEGIPPDAKCVNWSIMPPRLPGGTPDILLWYSSGEWDPLEDSQDVPTFVPVFKRVLED